MQERKKSRGIALTDSLYRRLKVAAAQRDVSLAKYVSDILEGHLKSKREGKAA